MKCKKHPEQEVVVIKFCPCCEKECRAKLGGFNYTFDARDFIQVQPLPPGAQPVYNRDTDAVETIINDDKED